MQPARGLGDVRWAALLLMMTLSVVGSWWFMTGRAVRRIAPEQARALAQQWLADRSSLEQAEVYEAKAFRSLPDAPQGRAVYGVSVKGEAAPFSYCLGVLVDARTGAVYGAVLGRDWVKCPG